MPVRHHALPLPTGTDARWQISLLGRLQAQRGDLTLTNFGSRSGAALLARLALHPQRSHAREELVELLWPGVAIDVGRNRLRQALFTLRQLLEPPGPMAAPVLVADRLCVRVLPDAFDCDALRFEQLARAGRWADAASLYAGELLPGFYDEWINDERLRLSGLADEIRQRLALAEPAAAESTAGAHALAGREPVSAPSPAEPPAARIALPVYLTRFFGRDGEGARLRAEVLSHRLVTLLGPGGSGKTRLAVELAAALREPNAGLVQRSRGQVDRAFDLIAFVPLVNCATRAQVLDALLASLHLRQQEDDPFAALAAALDGRRALLVLDNFEQLAGLAEDVVARLTMALAGLHLLVTSRRVLGIDGEREIAIPPLALPRADLVLAEAAINPAVALFVDRARAVRADFHIGPSNLAAIIDVVQRLEGMPLAIELGAARVRSIAPAAMASLLRDARIASNGQALELLNRSGPRSGADPRHASMLRVIEWSWRLLDAASARLLADLTVFHGSFTTAAVQAVCDVDGASASVQLDDLVANSLLRTHDVDVDAGATRYVQFEPVREYAALQLAPDRALALRAAHLAWLTTWAAHLPATPALAEVRAEQPNLLATLRNALADDAPDAAVRLMLPLRRVLEDVELPMDGLASLAAAIDRCSDAALRGQGHTLIGPLLFMAGRSADAIRHTALGLSAAPKGSPSRARALHADARVRWRAARVDDGISAQLDEAEALARANTDLELLASVLALRAFVVNGRGDHAEGERLHAQALALWEGLGNRHAANSGRYNLAACAQNAGRHAETLARLAEIEPDARALHDWRRLAQILNVRGNALSELRRWDEAAACFREGARLAWDTLALHELAYVLWNLPRTLAHVRQAESAVLLAAFAEAFWRTRFGRLSEGDRHDVRRVRRLAAVRLDAPRVALLWERGAAMSLAGALALALG